MWNYINPRSVHLQFWHRLLMWNSLHSWDERSPFRSGREYTASYVRQMRDAGRSHLL